MDYFDNMDEEKSFDERHRRDPGMSRLLIATHLKTWPVTLFRVQSIEHSWFAPHFPFSVSNRAVGPIFTFTFILRENYELVKFSAPLIGQL